MTAAPGVVFFCPGAAKGQPRAMSAIGLRGVYDPGTADAWKRTVRAALVAALIRAGRWPVVDLSRAAFGVDLRYWFERPRSHFRKDGRLRPQAPDFRTGKPDIDNLTKASLDALGTFDGQPPLLWCDDSQVTRLTVEKDWGDFDGCLFSICPLYRTDSG